MLHTLGKRFSVAIFLVFFVQLASFAATFTMKCAPNAAVIWSNPDSWEPLGVPGPGDDVIINCPVSSFVVSEVDITIKSLNVTKIGYFFGPGTLTVTERIDTKYPFFWQMPLIIGPNATGLMTDELAGQDVQGIIFYEDLTVHGSLTFTSREVSGKNITVNGVLTQNKGSVSANLVINPTGVLNLESPQFPIDLKTVNNKGTINWKKGSINASWGAFTNTGVINIEEKNAVFMYSGFISDFLFKNDGTINVASTVDSVSFLTRLVSSGDIRMLGDTKLNMAELDLSGSIIGATGSTLHLTGFNSSTESFLRGSSAVKVTSFLTNPSQILYINEGSDISEIDQFTFGRGKLEAQVVFPPSAKYVLQADMVTNKNQNFVGEFRLEGSISGDVVVTFDTPNLTANFGYFGGNTQVILSANTVVDLFQMGVSDMINNGIINIRPSGYLSGGMPGIVNNGTINTLGDMVSIFGYNNNENTGLIDNLGVINFNTKKAIVYAKLVNTGTINIGTNDTLSVFGVFNQNGLLTGQTGSKLSLGYSINDHTFNTGSITKDLAELEITIGTTVLKSGVILENITKVSAISGTLQTSIVLPPAFKYEFKDAKIRLNTRFEPTQLLEIEDTDIEGSGNIRINNTFNWFGGTLDVPIRINETAVVFIRENIKRPIISAPFTNTGDITLSGGIIEVNTAFFKNGGSWNIDSDEDVIIDGYTSFNNQGTFSICGDQPFQIIFNVPFINEASGTFKGQGSYTFNAGFTNEGAVAPGCSPGRLTIEDDVTSLKTIEIEVEGQRTGEFDELVINGDLTAGDWLKVIVPNGTVVNGSLKIIHTTGNFTGQFAKVDMPANFTLEYVKDGVLLSSNGTVSVSDTYTDSYGLALRPTVVQDNIILTADQPLPQGSSILVYDMQGMLVMTQDCQKAQQHQVNVFHIPNGVYVFKINTLPSWKQKVVVVK